MNSSECAVTSYGLDDRPSVLGMSNIFLYSTPQTPIQPLASIGQPSSYLTKSFFLQCQGVECMDWHLHLSNPQRAFTDW